MRSFQESRDTLSRQSLLLGPFRLKCPIFHNGTLPQRHISLFLHSNQVSGFFSRRNKFPHMSKVKWKKSKLTSFEMQKTCPQLVQSPRDQGTMRSMEPHCYSFKIPEKKALSSRSPQKPCSSTVSPGWFPKQEAGLCQPDAHRPLLLFLRHFGLYLLEVSKHREG